MARTLAELPKGRRITDYISLGVLTKTFPLADIKRALHSSGKASVRERDLPAHVVVYYVLALTLFMQVSYREVLRCLLEGLKFLFGPGFVVKVASKAGISQARSRLGWEPIRQLHDQVVKPIAVKATRGAWYRCWRLMNLDGSTLDVADTAENDEAFGRQKLGKGRSAFPQIRFVSLVESGTHVLFATEMGPFGVGEITLAERVVTWLKPGMLCLADRLFFSAKLWKKARARGADLLWRFRKNLRFPCEKRLSDGSYLSRIRPRRGKGKDMLVRVIEYRLEGVADAEPIYRLLTTIVDPEQAPAHELAALYHERWEIETTLDELKTHLRGARIVLRSKTPDLVRQEFYGFLMTHFAIRGLMHEAALKADKDPDRLSFVHAVRVVRRKLPLFVAIPPSAQESPA